MIGVATTAQVTPRKTERREMFSAQIFWLSATSVIPPKPKIPAGSCELMPIVFEDADAWWSLIQINANGVCGQPDHPHVDVPNAPQVGHFPSNFQKARGQKL
jgi:hypothetical protein